MQDFSFLRLKPTFAEAKRVDDLAVSELNYHNFISLLPTESYVQITNVSEGIAFDGDYQVLLVDCAETQLADITSKVGISEFTDKNGIPQISFELAYLNVDYYYKPVYLKFIHTTGSDTYYSNPFLITSDRAQETTRFDYKASGYFNGISYDRATANDGSVIMQSIRLRCYYDAPVNKTESKSYDQISTRTTITADKSIYFGSGFKFTYLNPFCIDRTEVLLSHDVIYINGVRCSNKPDLKTSDTRLGNSNLFEASFTASINRNDTYSWSLQIVPPLALESYLPLGFYTLDSLPTTLSVDFNKNVSASTGTIGIYDASDDSMIAEYTNDDFIVFGTGFTIGITGEITVNGSYYVLISDGLIISGAETFAGISDKTFWTFTVNNGDWDGDDWNNDDWFTD